LPTTQAGTIKGLQSMVYPWFAKAV
jgi:hypothetical protein